MNPVKNKHNHYSTDIFISRLLKSSLFHFFPPFLRISYDKNKCIFFSGVFVSISIQSRICFIFFESADSQIERARESESVSMETNWVWMDIFIKETHSTSSIIATYHVPNTKWNDKKRDDKNILYGTNNECFFLLFFQILRMKPNYSTITFLRISDNTNTQ